MHDIYKNIKHPIEIQDDQEIGRMITITYFGGIAIVIGGMLLWAWILS